MLDSGTLYLMFTQSWMLPPYYSHPTQISLKITSSFSLFKCHILKCHLLLYEISISHPNSGNYFSPTLPYLPPKHLLKANTLYTNISYCPNIFNLWMLLGIVQVTVVCLVNNKNLVGEDLIWKLKKKKNQIRPIQERRVWK